MLSSSMDQLDVQEFREVEDLVLYSDSVQDLS